MEFLADLHVHSYLSRATSRDMNLESLYVWAQLKGLQVVGTGDFTHPRWYVELRDKLEPAEPGLFRLRDDLACELDKKVPLSCRAPVRFMLSAEISTIYKKGDRTRKVHSVVLAPDLSAVARLNAALQEVGNISSDGRPILGLDCKELLRMVLEADTENVLIPAHVWTPHFSVLGAASGFESIEACFEDLTAAVFALETGLSSDPPMNWRVSGLDRFALVSNSDAHSPSKLGREANRFACELSYAGMMGALRRRDGSFAGTIEFFPEEGKYHYDGHRACGVCCDPAQTAACDGVCPQCGRKLTIGVMHRVQVLADCPAGRKPDQAPGFESLIPLVELISQVCGVGPNSKRVKTEYFRLLERCGSELSLLRTVPIADLQAAAGAPLARAIANVRSRAVTVSPGFDGQYGTISACDPLEPAGRQPSLF